MGKNQSKYEDQEMEEGRIVKNVQNVSKIHGLARLISAKQQHQQLVASQGWTKQDENMASFIHMGIQLDFNSNISDIFLIIDTCTVKIGLL